MKKGPKILLTGFNSFAKVQINPTEKLMEMVQEKEESFSPSCQVFARVLNTSYQQSLEMLVKLIEEISPQAVISFGVSQKATQISLERVALNINDSIHPDNQGVVRQSAKIASSGPAAYWSTLPLEDIFLALQEEGIPTAFSNHAGSYVCNHLFYGGLHFLEQEGKNIWMGFVHVPPLPEDPNKTPGFAGLEVPHLFRAAQKIIETVGRKWLELC